MKVTKALFLSLVFTLVYLAAFLLIHFQKVEILAYVLLFILPFCTLPYLNKMPNWLLILFSATILVSALIINLDKALVSVFPSLALAITSSLLIKRKEGVGNFIYASLSVAFAALCLGVGIIASNQGIFFYRAFMRLLNMSRSANNYLAPTICLIVCFLEAVALYLFARFVLQNKDFTFAKKPRFYLAFLAALALILAFIPFKDASYRYLAMIAAIIYAIPIAIYGYQNCNKLILLLAIQAGTFLVVSLSLLLLVFENERQILAYIIMFLPVIIFAYYLLISKKTEPLSLTKGKKHG